jgi:5-formyltetrahydrofolate cyclo-ligase
MRQAHLSWGHKYLPGAVPVGLVGPAYGAHLQQQATEDISGQRFCSSADFSILNNQGPDVLSDTSIDKQKSGMREQARLNRAEFAASAPADYLTQFSDHLYRLLIGLRQWHIISGYLSIGDEIDPLPVLNRLSDEGKTCVLPVVVASETPLIFRVWQQGDALEKGPLNTRHPLVEAPTAEPDIVLVPLLAFDEHGYRLGWGGGFYDRTLAGYRERGRDITTIGIAFSGQKVDHVPHDAYDQRVDYIVTEAGVTEI